MRRHLFTHTVVFLAFISTVFPLPAPPYLNSECRPSQLQSLGPGGILTCSFQPSNNSPATQTLKQRNYVFPAGRKVRPHSRKARAKARVANGQPKATSAERGRTGAEREKPRPTMTARKAAKVTDRKDDRVLGKKRKHVTLLAKARQKHIPPPFGMDHKGALIKQPLKTDMSEQAWNNQENARKAKQVRKAAYDALSPEEKADKEKVTTVKQAASRQKDIHDNTKENNQQKRVKSKAAANSKRKTTNRKHAAIARAAYAQAQRMPTRDKTFISPQKKQYNGKDVRQAIFASELAQAKGGVGYNGATGKESKLKDKLPKNFFNKDNADGALPLPGVSPLPNRPLSEFPIVHDKQKGHDGRKPTPSESRIITQKNAAGHTELKGLVGHPSGEDDHVAFHIT